MDYNDLAQLIFPDVCDISYYEEKYPKRNLKDNAIVTRTAPSPTGNVHIGTIYQALVAKHLANQTDGVFFLRIEDTDQKREVENGIEQISYVLKLFNLEPDEGLNIDKTDNGLYGPYLQSKREQIYKAYAKYLISIGKAYPCFCSQEKLDENRKKQEDSKIRPGYYGIWATCRNLPVDEQIRRIKNNEPYVIRFKSSGREDRKIKHKDLIKGNVVFPENDLDIVIIKSDGLPTYHFAHAIDDHLMRTNLVIRGDEWLSSIPLHLELFNALGFEVPKYAHIAPIMKNDNGNKRKLSKRKDFEAAAMNFVKKGIPTEATSQYLLNIANSNFENWARQNKDKNSQDFPFEINKMSVSGALFDMVKLYDISKNVISKMSTQEVYDLSLNWAKENDAKLLDLLENKKDFCMSVIGIERGNQKPRKDISCWEDLYDSIIYLDDENFLNTKQNYEYQKINDKEKIKEILENYPKYMNLENKDTWFENIKDLSQNLGYAREVKLFKQEPEKYSAHVGDVSTVIRVALTSRCNTPDLFEIMQVLGKDSVLKRLQKAIDSLND